MGAGGEDLLLKRLELLRLLGPERGDGQQSADVRGVSAVLSQIRTRDAAMGVNANLYSPAAVKIVNFEY